LLFLVPFIVLTSNIDLFWPDKNKKMWVRKARVIGGKLQKIKCVTKTTIRRVLQESI
jgi:hypothetical protein